MTAIRFQELLSGDSLEYDDRYEINYSSVNKIDPSVRLEQYVIIDENVSIGPNTIIGGFTHIRSNTKIGANCKVGAGTVFEGDVEIGNHVRIGTKCTFCWGARIGNNVFIGDGWQGANDKEMVWGTKKQDQFKPNAYTIEDNVRIGLSCVALAGITIGHDSVVGAGSVITKSVEPNTKVYGNPARNVSKEKEESEKLNERIATYNEKILKFFNLPESFFK